MSKESTKQKKEREVQERTEYRVDRVIRIEWAKNASDKLNNMLFLLSTGAFIYTQTLFQKNWSDLILAAWFLFLISLISVVLIYFLSWKSHALSLDNYDYEYRNNEEDDNWEDKVRCLNCGITILEYISIIFTILGLIFIFSSYLS